MSLSQSELDAIKDRSKLRSKSFGQQSASQMLARYGLVGILALEILIFCIVAPNQFGTLLNLRTTLLRESVLAILALAVLMPLIAGEFDVSLAAVFTVSMLLAATLIQGLGSPIWLAFIIAIGAATAIGALTGALVILTRANSLIVSLGMMILMRGVSEGLTQGSTIVVGGEAAKMLRFVSRTYAGGMLPIILLISVAFLIWFLTEMTPLGRKWYAIGGSNEGAKLAGLRNDALKVGAFATGGMLAGLASILQLSASTTATASFGNGYLFPAIASAFLGAVCFRIGAFNVWGTLTAIFVLSVGVSGLKMSGAPLWIDGVFYGLSMIVASAVVQAIWRRKA
jgi:ribose transport system permease protein